VNFRRVLDEENSFIAGDEFPEDVEQRSFVAAGSPGYRYIYFEPDQPKGTTDASVITDNHGTLDDVRPLLELPEVDGVIYKPYSPYNGLHGAMSCGRDSWGNDKFAVSYKFLLWENHANDSPQEVANAISEMPSSPNSDPGSYALINVHAWSWNSIGGPVEAVKQTIDLLPPKTRVVTINDFFALLKGNFKCSGFSAGSLSKTGSATGIGQP
jgi:hypothetical protein